MNSERGFLLVPGFYDSVPAFVLWMVRGFRESPEATLLSQGDLKLPSVVVGCFRAYLERRVHETLTERVTPLDILDGFHVIEDMSRCGDHEVQNLVLTDIFEPLSLTGDALNHFSCLLGVESRKLFEEYCGGDDLIV